MKIAVLVPVYNAERYLRECLDSLLAQGVDVFCCDDGSTDGSRAILAEYERESKSGVEVEEGNESKSGVEVEERRSSFDSASTTGKGATTLHVIRQANAGVVAVRNRLMDELPPEYDAFAFCDSDDYVKDGMYARLAEAMERTGADVAECGMPGNEVARETVVDDMSVYLLRRTAPGPWINVVNKLYRREAVGKIRFRTGLRFEEDFFFNYEVNAAIRRKVLLPGVDYTYRTNPDSATQNLNLPRYFESASRRIRLSLEVFWKAGRIPKAVEPAWRAELSKDIYRMCIRKNLKKNRHAVLRRELFREAGAFLSRLEGDSAFTMVGLNPIQRLILCSCRKGWYGLASILVLLT